MFTAGIWFWIGFGSALSVADEFVEWTSAAGTTLKAKFVDERDGKLTLVKENGERLVLRLDQLDEASQKKAREFSAALEEVDEALAESDEGVDYSVETLKDGEWKGFHAVYDREKFVAVVEKGGRVRIYLKEDGKRIKGVLPRRLKLGIHYKNGAERDPKVISITSKAAATTDPKKLSFSGKTDAGASFEVNYEFKDDTIKIYGTLRDRDSGAILLLGMGFPKLKGIEASMSESEKKELLGDSWIKAITEDGTELEFELTTIKRFAEDKRISNGLRSVTIKSEKSGPYLIKCTAPDSKHGRLVLRNISSKIPYEGFAVPLLRSDPTERSSRAGLTVEIE